MTVFFARTPDVPSMYTAERLLESHSFSLCFSEFVAQY